MVLPLSYLMWTLLGAFALFYITHFLRQVIIHTKRERPNQHVESNFGQPIIAFDNIQRASHWLFAVVMTILVITGFYVYMNADIALNHTSLLLLFTHDYISIALLALILIHVYHDTIRKKGYRLIAFSMRDVVALKQRVKNFFGEDSQPVKAGKYDVFLKGYHWLMASLLTVLGATGVYYWDPLKLVINFPQSIAILLLNLHIISATLVTGMMVGHVYFSFLPQNRPILRSILSGRLDYKFYYEHFDTNLWEADLIWVPASVIARLTSSLPDTAFTRVTGIMDRRLLATNKRLRIRFQSVQKICGRYSVKRGMGWCSQKHAACSANSCPALGTYTPPEIDLQRRRFIKQLVGAIAIAGLMATGLGYLIKEANNRNPIGGGGSGASGSTTTTQGIRPITNLNSLPKNSSIDFVGPNGNPDLLIRLSDGSLAAYSRVCTHAGCLVDYIPQYGVIYCPCHGSVFNPKNGYPTQGPAYTPLPKIQIYIDQAGNIYAE